MQVQFNNKNHKELRLSDFPGINSRILELGEDILQSDRYRKAETVVHHGTTSVYRHSLAVARYTLARCIIDEARGKEVSERDAVRAALLHDIGMTDDEVHDALAPQKCYLHPKRSAEIAEKEFHANEVQLDSILHHMWPLNVVPPKYREGWILILADKHCSLNEVVLGQV